MPIDFDAQFGQGAAARDDDIVDGQSHVDRLAVAQHAAFKQGAALGLETPAENLAPGHAAYAPAECPS